MDSNEDEKQAAYERRRAEMTRLMERHLEAESTPRGLAYDACVSRYHFQRVFRDVMGETPGDLQRRLRLERAAHDLRSTESEVTTIGLDAGYSSLEGFSRAFRRAYGQSPSQFRRVNTGEVDLQGASLVHYDAVSRRLLIAKTSRRQEMDLTDRLLDNDYRAKRSLLESALALTDVQLDAPLLLRIKLVPWMEPDKTIRQTLERLTDMGWVREMLTTIKWPFTGAGWQENDKTVTVRTVQELISRLDSFYSEYLPFVQHVRANSLWDTTWVDGACEPVETFTYATVIEEGLERGIFRRLVAQRLLEQIGLPTQW